ncbi:MAG: ABC transporter permease subunit, partial [Terrabacter sp.]|nr:ABC transporter permease subunit [Terrabacter sp.]
MTWFIDHLDDVWSRGLQHAYLAGLPLLLGLLVALPLGWLARRFPFLYAPFTAGFGLLYTIPSLAFFVVLPTLTRWPILDARNVLVAMTIYTIALLVRTVADGLGAVPDHVQQSATAMGYTRVKRFFAIELPLAVPVISAGLRVAAVSNVSIVSVATIIGVNQLGLFFSDGFNRDFYDPLFVGI